MAKVKIQGHASGTGILTVTAPNTSTDRTITLPDSTDTLAVNSDVTNKLPLAGGTVTGQIAIDQNSNARALTIDSESTSETGIVIDASVLTTGRAAHFYSNAPDNSTRDLVHVENVHASSTGTTAFKVTQNSTGLAADFIGDKIRAREGILFGTDTAAANALDDYEEGTFTPTIDSSSYKGGTWSTIAGWYTKIGNTVTVWVGITGSGIYINNAQGYVPISGAPFSAYMPTTLNTYSGTWSADTVTKALSGAVYLNGTNFYLHSSNPSFNTSGANAIAFSVTYQTTA